MDFKTFLEKIKECGFGVVSFNTYDKHFEDETWTFCFLMVAEKGHHGIFIKEECRIDDLEIMLDSIFRVVKDFTESAKRKAVKAAIAAKAKRARKP